MKLHGLLAEFDQPEPLVEAVRRARAEGYRDLDAYSPFPHPELPEALGFRKDRVALLALLGGLFGGGGGYFMQWYANVVDYRINIGGRPMHSWPAFIPITFEMTVLFAALAAAFGMLALNRLPRLHHPVFEAPSFIRASKDRFFLCILAHDPRFDADGTRRFLAGLEGTLGVQEATDED